MTKRNKKIDAVKIGLAIVLSIGVLSVGIVWGLWRSNKIMLIETWKIRGLTAIKLSHATSVVGDGISVPGPELVSAEDMEHPADYHWRLRLDSGENHDFNDADYVSTAELFRERKLIYTRSRVKNK